MPSVHLNVFAARTAGERQSAGGSMCIPWPEWPIVCLSSHVPAGSAPSAPESHPRHQLFTTTSCAHSTHTGGLHALQHRFRIVCQLPWRRHEECSSVGFLIPTRRFRRRQLEGLPAGVVRARGISSDHIGTTRSHAARAPQIDSRMKAVE